MRQRWERSLAHRLDVQANHEQSRDAVSSRSS